MNDELVFAVLYLREQFRTVLKVEEKHLKHPYKLYLKVFRENLEYLQLYRS